MKRFIQSFFCITLLSLGATLRAKDCDNGNGDCNGVEVTGVPSPVRAIIIPRSQGANTARELIGWQDFIHLCDICETYGALAVEFEYTRSFRPARIARQLFGVSATAPVTGGTTSGCDNNGDDNFFLRFQGSQVTNRSANSLLADNFGLSQNFDGTLKIRPRIDNFIVDFQYYMGLDCWVPGLYFRAHLPITHTRWNLFDVNGRDNDCPTPTSGTTASASGIEIINSGSQNTPFPACYMATETVTPATSILQALSGDFTFGNMNTEWKFGKFTTKRQDITRLADIDLILGYDFLCNDCYHFGAYLQAVAPTGNSPDACTIFEPIAGDGAHWKLGGGISAHSVIWESDCDQNLSIWLEGNAVHLFRNTQTRSFDLKNHGPLSRYMLLKQFDSNGVYTGNLINAINFTTRRIESSFDVEGDVSFKFAYRNCGFMADLGYNFWGRKEEDIRLCQNITGQQETGNTADGVFGVKGCQGVCFQSFPTATDDGNTVIAEGPPTAPQVLNSTAANATAFTCETMVSNPMQVTPGTADPVALAYNSVRTVGTVTAPTPATGVVFATQSNPPVRLTVNDINFIGVPSAITHKVFGYVGYTWYECDFTPFIGIHGEVEFDSRRNRSDCPTVTTSTTPTTTATTTDARHDDRAINQWGIGIKGGISF